MVPSAYYGGLIVMVEALCGGLQKITVGAKNDGEEAGSYFLSGMS